MVEKTKKKRAWKAWTRSMVVLLRRHSRARTPVRKLEKIFKRSGATIRAKAYTLGLSMGHQKRRKRAA